MHEPRDFDSACHGWLVRDLTGVAGAPHPEEFLNGYRRHGSFTAVDEKALPWLRGALTVANLRSHLVDKPRFAATGEPVWIEDALATLCEVGAMVGICE